MIFFSPLEQFEIFIIYPFILKSLDFSITNFFFSIFIIFVFIINFIFIFIKNNRIFNIKIMQFIIESLYKFVYIILMQQTNKNGKFAISFALNLFIIIFLSNFIGLFAIGFTLTSQITVTALLAFSINIGLLIFSFYLHGIKFFNFFIPKGIPAFLIPFMIIIEIFSYSIRSISLFVRLFANMMAGHTLLHIISSFFITLFWNYTYYISFLSLVLLIAIFILEIAIAFLQAYVFLTLFCIYLNDALSGGH